MALVILASLAAATPAHAELTPRVGELRYAGCISGESLTVNCEQIEGAVRDAEGTGLEYPDALTVSPDGSWLYAGAAGNAALTLFRRAPGDGSVEYERCLSSDFRSRTCDEAPDEIGTAMGAPRSVLVSADGRDLYVGSFGIVHFRRNPATGALAYADCIRDEKLSIPANLGECRSVSDNRGFAVQAQLVESPDGRTIYARTRTTLSWFHRDAETGRLDFRGCVVEYGSPESPCTRLGNYPYYGLDDMYDFEISPDGSWLYVANQDGIAIFSLDSGTGTATFSGCVTGDTEVAEAAPLCRGIPRTARWNEPGSGLSNPTQLSMSPDGKSLYAISQDEDAVTALAIEPDGSLRWIGCITGSTSLAPGACDPLPYVAPDGLHSGMNYPLGVAAANGEVYVGSSPDGAVNVFSRNADGSLSYEGCISGDGEGGWPENAGVPTVCEGTGPPDQVLFEKSGMNGTGRLTLSPDGRWLYSTSSGDNAINRFRIGGPTASLTSGPRPVAQDRRPTFGISRAEGVTAECAVDAEPFEECGDGGVYRTTTLPDGHHVLALRATGPTGQRTVLTRGFIVDNEPPETVLHSTPRGAVNRNWVVMGGGTTEASRRYNPSFICKMVGPQGEVQPDTYCDGGTRYSNLPDGDYHFELSAIDEAGNVDPTPAMRDFVIDTTPPALSIISGPSGQTGEQRPTFDFVAEPQTDVSCSIDKGSPSHGPCSDSDSHTPATALGDGAYVFRLKAVDAAGNVTSLSRSFSVEAQPPALQISSGPGGPTKNPQPVFGFAAEPGATLACSIDSGSEAFGACAGAGSHSPASALAEGAYTFRVRAVDASGKVSTAIRDFSVDQSPPNLAITAGPAGPTKEKRPRFEFSAEDGSQVRCSVDRGSEAFEPCSGSALHAPESDLSEGAHTFRVRATDAAGNVATLSRAFQVDTGPPALEITSGPSGPTSDATPTFGFDPEAGAGVECSLDTGSESFGPCTEPGAHTSSVPLPDAVYTFRVAATDAAGNRVARTRWFQVDTVAPETTASTTRPRFAPSRTAQFTLGANELSTFECALFGAGDLSSEFEACSATPLYTQLADGEYIFRARATDAAKNADASPVELSFVVDTVSPDTEILSGPGGRLSEGRATFAFASTESIGSFECRLDGVGGWTECGTPAVFAELPDGRHRFEVRAVDRGGLKDGSPALSEFTVERPSVGEPEEPETPNRRCVRARARLADAKARLETALRGGSRAGIREARRKLRKARRSARSQCRKESRGRL